MAKDTESTVVPTQTQDAPADVVVNVLSRYRIEKNGDDANMYERIRLNDQYKGKKGVYEFVASNGKVTYYAEKLVKKYSDNVVTE